MTFEVIENFKLISSKVQTFNFRQKMLFIIYKQKNTFYDPWGQIIFWKIINHRKY